jgi:hypothetical protein
LFPLAPRHSYLEIPVSNKINQIYDINLRNFMQKENAKQELI